MSSATLTCGKRGIPLKMIDTSEGLAPKISFDGDRTPTICSALFFASGHAFQHMPKTIDTHLLPPDCQDTNKKTDLSRKKNPPPPPFPSPKQMTMPDAKLMLLHSTTAPPNE